MDPGIRHAVRVLREGGIETIESCQGGRGHSFFEPTVCFSGSYDDGFKALAVAIEHGLPVHQLRRCYTITEGELIGPDWEITFWPE
jgi:hypothetical protein